MSIEAFKAQLDAARRITVALGEPVKRFHLVAPTDHAWRCAVEANRDAAGRVLQVQAFRGILAGALVGWESVTTTDIDPAAVEEPLPYSQENAALLLDYRQDIADELTIAIGQHLAARRDKLEAARKLVERTEYELNAGVGALCAGMTAPDSTRETELALAVWSFCAGWNPERIPLAVAYYGVEDLDLLVDQLLVVRRKVEEHRRAQE